MRIATIVMCLAAWAASSCAGSQPRVKPSPGDPDAHFELTVWFQDDPRLPKALVLAACAEWAPEGVACIEKPKALARVRVYMSDAVCDTVDADKKRHIILGRAWQGGTIEMMTKCLDKKKDGSYDAVALQGVLAHEFGHQDGVWEHVPSDCSDKDIKTHPSGRKICGVALMNPYFTKKVVHITEMDHLAFDLRDPKFSMLLGDPAPNAAPDCIYEAPAP